MSDFSVTYEVAGKPKEELARLASEIEELEKKAQGVEPQERERLEKTVLTRKELAARLTRRIEELSAEDGET